MFFVTLHLGTVLIVFVLCFYLHLQKYNPIIIVPTFYAKNYEKHCGGLPSGWRRKASKERLPTVVIALAFANIVTFVE